MVTRDDEVVGVIGVVFCADKFGIYIMMKRLKNEASSVRRFKLSYVLLGLAAFYLVLISVKFLEFLESATVMSGNDADVALDVEDDSGESISVFHNSVREYS